MAQQVRSCCLFLGSWGPQIGCTGQIHLSALCRCNMQASPCSRTHLGQSHHTHWHRTVSKAYGTGRESRMSMHWTHVSRWLASFSSVMVYKSSISVHDPENLQSHCIGCFSVPSDCIHQPFCKALCGRPLTDCSSPEQAVPGLLVCCHSPSPGAGVPVSGQP